MTLTDRLLGRFGLQRSIGMSADLIAAFQSSLSTAGYVPPTTMGRTKVEEIKSDFRGLVVGTYANNPVVFACVNARVQLFSEARLQFQELKEGRPGKLFQGPSTYLRGIENGGTGKLLKDMLLDSDFAGNSFTARRPNQYQRLRPDWTIIIAGNPRSEGTTWDLDTEVLGYGYQPDGPTGGKKWEFLQASEVAHFAPVRDPLRRFAGMSWILSVMQELYADGAATTHKLQYFENAATPNLGVHFDATMTKAQAQDWIDLFHQNHEGAKNAYKTLFLGGGSSVSPIGSSLKDADFSEVQGAGELRIASAAGVPPIIIGLAGGLDAATYSNYGQARRAFADLTMRPLWRDMAGALENIVQVPEQARLWYDDRDISFLQEDVKDAADIQAAQASTIRQLIDAGYKADTVVEAVVAGDFNRLDHSGLFSVQLQPAGTTQPKPPEAALPQQKPALLNSSNRSAETPLPAEVRCPSCNRLQFMRTSHGGSFEIKCRGCSTMVAA